jgi:hypothetical protein
MITALVSTVLGLVGGTVPDLLREYRDHKAHSREVEMLRVQAQLQIDLAKHASDNRLREVEAQSAAQEAFAWREHMATITEAQARPSGSAWIDGFNAVLRPSMVAGIMALFFCVASTFCMAVVLKYIDGQITAEVMAQIIWGSLVGESIQACLGYLFGYRTASKAAK